MPLTRRSPLVPSTVAGRQHLDAGAPCRLRQGALRVGAHIGDGGDRDAGRLQIKGSLVGRVVCGHQHRAVADPHAVAVEIGLRGAGQHDARTVVARKHQRPLDRAGRQHHRLGAHLPQALARLAPAAGRARWSLSRSFRPMKLCGK